MQIVAIFRRKKNILVFQNVQPREIQIFDIFGFELHHFTIFLKYLFSKIKNYIIKVFVKSRNYSKLSKI